MPAAKRKPLAVVEAAPAMDDPRSMLAAAISAHTEAKEKGSLSCKPSGEPVTRSRRPKLILKKPAKPL
jgi:hypothetical protein